MALVSITESRPEIIQGGMGVDVSSPRLAGAVAACGMAGVVSGTATGDVLARRLQDGDSEVYDALTMLPDGDLVDRITDIYYSPKGRENKDRYRLVPRNYRIVDETGEVFELYDEQFPVTAEEMALAGAFMMVTRAQRYAAQSTDTKGGDRGPIGINLLTELRMPTASTLYGAMLAGVDFVVMGAGIPSHIPGILDRLAQRDPAQVNIQVPKTGHKYFADFDPRRYPGLVGGGLVRPDFLAIISLEMLAKRLASKGETRPNGFVVEHHTAGGHNAPPRSKKIVDGQAVYDDKDEPDFNTLVGLNLPFWLAGSRGSPKGLKEAQALGAAGVQVGSLFALSKESGMDPEIRAQVLDAIRKGELDIVKDAHASPTGFPFMVARKNGVKWPDGVEQRACQASYLTGQREIEDASGKRSLVSSCPAEPTPVYLRKMRRVGVEDAQMGDERLRSERAQCLCRKLLATAGIGDSGMPPIVTLGGDAVEGVPRLDDTGKTNSDGSYEASTVVEYVLGRTV